MRDFIKEKAEGLAKEVIELRRHLHQYPELGGQEYETSRFIADYLKKIGIEVEEGIANTGVVGLIKGEGLNDGDGSPRAVKTIALRADMDALPITEQSEKVYKSTKEGVMHACGHDAHVAILLVTAKVLWEIKHLIKGNVKLIFQPSEEFHPGGALPMIEAGVLENPKVDSILGLHVNPYISSGVVAYSEGAIMANADNFALTLKGKGGHGASPHRSVDAIVLSAMVINALQLLPSRFIDPLEPVVVTVGTIHGGYKTNVIADKVELKGTIRTLSPALRKEVPEKIEELVAGIAKGYGGDYNFQYYLGYPALINNKEITLKVKTWASEILGSAMVEVLAKPSMGGEDFAYFTELIPGSYFHLGAAPQGEIYPWHHPSFDINEEALVNGIAVMAYSSYEYLNKG